MKLEYQVCTLKQTKILKDELGLELDTYFVWHKNYIRDEDYPEEWVLNAKEDAIFDLDKGLIDNYYPAPSCAELGVLLPSIIRDEEQETFLSIERKGDLNIVKYRSKFNNIFNSPTAVNQYEAHVKTDLLIHLLKEKIINPTDLTLEDK